MIVSRPRPQDKASEKLQHTERDVASPTKLDKFKSEQSVSIDNVVPKIKLPPKPHKEKLRSTNREMQQSAAMGQESEDSSL